MSLVVAALSPDSDFVAACYIAAFALFIFGIRQGTHPTTARRGNLKLDFEDEIVAGACITHDGEIRNERAREAEEIKV